MQNQPSEQRPTLYYFFCDESGSVGDKSERYVISAMLISNSVAQLNKLVDQVIIDSRKFLKRRLKKGYPLHAASDEDELIAHLLKTLAQTQGNSLCLGILDKTMCWQRRSLTSNQIYHRLVAHTARCALANAGLQAEQVQMVIESPHTKARLRRDLAESIMAQTQLNTEQIIFGRKSSTQWARSLQIADYVSWSWFQKFEFSRPDFADLVTSLVVCEDVVGLDAEGNIRPTSDLLPGGEQ